MHEWITDFFRDRFQLDLSDKPVELWLLAAAVAVITYLVLRLLVGLVGYRLGTIAERTDSPVAGAIAELIKKTRWWLLLLIALFAGSMVVELSARIQSALQSIIVIALLVQLGIWANAALGFTLEHYRQRQIKKDPASVTALNAIGWFGKLLLWLAVLLLAFDNLGFDVTALIAGLGVGGIAVALAVQNILGDLFASLSILIDKPFVVGDFLIIDDYLGSVEHVGLKTTRMRSLSGEQLVFSNSDLLNSRLRNYGRMFERRVAFTIGVTYQTPRDKLKQIPGIMRSAIEAQDKTRFDRSHFSKYGDFSLNVETVYYVQGPDYNLYMDIQQAINLYVHEQFEKAGIEFAYPTQTLFVQRSDAIEDTA
ncbi:MAG: mechanosensitive ion channel family protein [Thiogranum sp.]|nr:mechanosensitive ion channel family protein [Thiogranum sp.]